MSKVNKCNYLCRTPHTHNRQRRFIDFFSLQDGVRMVLLMLNLGRCEVLGDAKPGDRLL